MEEKYNKPNQIKSEIRQDFNNKLKMSLESGDQTNDFVDYLKTKRLENQVDEMLNYANTNYKSNHEDLNPRAKKPKPDMDKKKKNFSNQISEMGMEENEGEEEKPQSRATLDELEMMEVFREQYEVHGR